MLKKKVIMDFDFTNLHLPILKKIIIDFDFTNFANTT